MRHISYFFIITLFLCFSGCTEIKQSPNVILILTDDQGYGDMSCNGNPWLKTPYIDALHANGVRFTNYHVGTTCAPTRSGLMTGMNCNRVGVWHTINGRSLLRHQEQTLADVLKENGYATSIFGKWHLGDNYPYRPEDRGFDEALTHGGGGVGQTPDYWNNDYFDDTYFRNGKPEKVSGYCTDVFFKEAIKWIGKNKENPFFCYISTNAPHTPLHVEQRYAESYKNNQNIKSPNFYGMIANLDENIGKLSDYLKENKLIENTILVFMTDNGTIEGAVFKNGELVKGYNAGMSGLKSSPLDGGHRVPFFINWEHGGIEDGYDVNELASYTDFMPTILDLCGIKSDIEFEGTSLKPLIYGEKKWEERTLVVDTQREEFLKKGKSFAVMTNRWRLVGKKLFDIQKDPAQLDDIAGEYPDVVNELSVAYEDWWKNASQNKDIYERIVIKKNGLEHALTVHDCHMTTGYPAWNQDMIRSGTSENGFWALKVEEAGTYKFELRRWPRESKLALGDAAPAGGAIPGGTPYTEGKVFSFHSAKLKLNDTVLEAEVDEKSECVTFTTELEPGDYNVQSWLMHSDEDSLPAFYLYVLGS